MGSRLDPSEGASQDGTRPVVMEGRGEVRTWGQAARGGCGPGSGGAHRERLRAEAGPQMDFTIGLGAKA